MAVMKARNGMYIGGGSSTSIIKVVGDGVKTYREILDSMFSAISDFDYLDAERLVCRIGKSYYYLDTYNVVDGIVKFSTPCKIAIDGTKSYQNAVFITNNNTGAMLTQTTNLATSPVSITMQSFITNVAGVGYEFEIIML